MDSVTEILSIKKKDIALPPEHLMGTASLFLSGMAKVGTGIKIILDTEKLQVYDSEGYHRRYQAISGKEHPSDLTTFRKLSNLSGE